MLVLGFLSCLLAVVAQAQADESDLSYNTPQAVQRCMHGPLAARYSVDASVNPFYLRGDFDGDGKMDYLVRVAAKQNKKRGLIACWGQSGKQPAVVGAGTPILHSDNSRFDDLPMIGWSVYGKRAIEQGAGEGPPPKLIGEAVYIDASESASGIVYWTGKTFRWYQQGD